MGKLEIYLYCAMFIYVIILNYQNSFRQGINLIKHTYQTPQGVIHYWLNMADENLPTLVFLPGLTADHRLFDKQVEYFKGKYNVFVWDAPGHGLSWPFSFDFDLTDKAKWLCEILEKENIRIPVIVGQSMGGYVGQCFAQLYPGKLKGFVSIDSAPLQRKYITKAEIWLLKRMEPVYRYYPWKALLYSGSQWVATTAYGKQLMYDIMMDYSTDKKRYAQLSGHGMKLLAQAYEKDLPYEITCPAVLICGEKDMAGSARSYNRRWHKNSNIPLYWIKNAGHNSNTDKPEEINRIIENLIKSI